MNYEEITKRLRIVDAIKGAKDADNMSMEDADYDLLKKLFLEFRFRFAHEDIGQIGGDLLDAETTPALVKEKAA